MMGLKKRSKDRSSIFRDKKEERPAGASPDDTIAQKVVVSDDSDHKSNRPDQKPTTAQSQASRNTERKRRSKWWKSPVSSKNRNNSQTHTQKSETTKSMQSNAKTLLDGTLKTEETETDEGSSDNVIPNSPSDSSDDDSEEEDGDSSSSSLLPMHSFSFSDDEEQEDDMQALTKELKGIQRLELKLELKRERLRKLCAGRRSSYTKLLEANTDAADAIELASYKVKHVTVVPPEEEESLDADNDSSDSDSKSGDSDSAETETHSDDAAKQQTRPDSAASSADRSSSHPTTAEKANVKSNQPNSMSLWWILFFEFNHTLPAIFIVLVVLMGHISFYSGLEVLLKSIYYSGMDHYFTLDQFFLTQIILGLVLLRLNGTLFYWLDQNDFALVRLEFQNRLKLGTVDAQFMKRIKGSVVCSAMNMFGYYLASVGLFHFYYNGSLKVLKPFEDWYMVFFQTAGGTFYAETGLPETPACHKLVELVAPSGQYSQKLIHYFCADETQEWRAITLAYHGLWFVAAAGLGAFIGQNVLEYCD